MSPFSVGEPKDSGVQAQYLGPAFIAPSAKGRHGVGDVSVLRKTNATLSRKAGVDAKVSADQRGHGLGVSMEVYTISDRQQKREAVNKLESAVALKRQPKLPEKA